MEKYEVEVKAVLGLETDGSDLERVSREMEEKIVDLGAVMRCDIDQDDIYLSHPCRDLFLTDEAFRVRIEEKKGGRLIKVTYKGPKVSSRSKARIEKEIELDEVDVKEILDMLSCLGFRKVISVKKSRRSYELDGMEIDLDRVSDLGLFLEVERISEDVKGSETRIMNLLEEIGCGRFERRSYMELLLGKQF